MRHRALVGREIALDPSCERLSARAGLVPRVYTEQRII